MRTEGFGRRDFLKTAGAAGLGAAFTSLGWNSAASAGEDRVAADASRGAEKGGAAQPGNKAGAIPSKVAGEGGPTLRRRYATVGGRQVHYVRAGSGPAFVVLHESPLSFYANIPLIRTLAAHFTVIGFDTPGYGNSDTLPMGKPEIRDYADAYADTLDALGVKECAIMGSHTGAAIAFEFARRHPERTTAAILDGFPVFTVQESEELEFSYLKPFEPSYDGSHLVWAWSRFRDQHVFFPWYRKSRSVRLDLDVPSPDDLTGFVRDLVRSGDNYRIAYSAAFRYLETMSGIPQIRVPMAFIAREDDLLYPQLDRLPASLPPNITIGRLSRDRAAWMEWIRRFVNAQKTAAAPPEPAENASLRDRAVTRGYVDVADLQVAYRRTASPGRGRPLVMLHDAPGASATLEPLMIELAKTREVIAFDIPGMGDSDAPAGPAPDVDAFARMLVAAIRGLGLKEWDLYGRQLGAVIAVAVARVGGAPGRLVLEGLPLFTPDEARSMQGRLAPRVEPDVDGAHLLHIWNYVRDTALFWPWYNQTRAGIRWNRVKIDAVTVHKRAVEVIKAYKTHHLATDAALREDLGSRLASVGVPTLVCATEEDPLRERTGRATMKNALHAVLPLETDEAARHIVRFLDGRTN